MAASETVRPFSFIRVCLFIRLGRRSMRFEARAAAARCEAGRFR